MVIAIVLILDLVLTILAANIVGPAAFRFSHYVLPGFLFRAPFYLLRFYIGVAAILMRQSPNWYFWGSLTGLAFTLPLAFWARLPICPPAEPWVNLATGILQGLFLGWAAVRLSARGGSAIL